MTHDSYKQRLVSSGALVSHWSEEELFLWRYLRQPDDFASLRIVDTVSASHPCKRTLCADGRQVIITPMPFHVDDEPVEAVFGGWQGGAEAFLGKYGLAGCALKEIPCVWLAEPLAKEALQKKWSTLMVSNEGLLKFSPLQFWPRHSSIATGCVIELKRLHVSVCVDESNHTYSVLCLAAAVVKAS